MGSVVVHPRVMERHPEISEEMNALLGLTEEELDARAAEYENDTWDASNLGKVTVGRPLAFGEPMKILTFKEPESTVRALDARARELGMSRSDLLRRMVDRELALA